MLLFVISYKHFSERKITFVEICEWFLPHTTHRSCFSA